MMSEILDALCALLAKVTGSTIQPAFGLLTLIWIAIEMCFYSVELLIWGERFFHVGDTILTIMLSLLFLYYIIFLARIS